MRARTWCLVAGFALVSELGCSASGVRYSGVVSDPAVTPDGVAFVASEDGSTELGVIHALCELPDDGLEDGVTLGDLSCSEELLRSAMRETAARVGGTHLVDTTCTRDGAETSCDAHVFRRASASAGRPPRHLAFDPFAIEVRLHPRPAAGAPSRPAARTDMVPRLPVSDRVFAQVSAQCDGQCDVRALREAVALGAEHAGAVHFGYPECRGEAPASGQARSCRAWASAYDVDFAPAK